MNPTLYDDIDLSAYSAEFQMVTPDMATEWLASNVGNRNPKANKRAGYRRDMLAGAWQVTGESIKFAPDGRLLDGQNRLMAIVETGLTVPLLVVRGVADKAQVVMDSGASRIAADALTMAGVSHAPVTASASRFAIAWQRGAIHSSDSAIPTAITNTEINEFSLADPHIQQAAALGSGACKSVPAPPSAIAAAAWLTLGVAPFATHRFIDDLKNMRTEGKGDPRYTLLQRLNSIKAGRERVPQTTYVFYIIRAWNAWREEKPLGNLKTGNLHGSFDFPKPI